MSTKIFKRAEYLSWDEYFMGVAHLASLRSKDPNSQVGACIVGANNTILSMGYNGFPRGCSDDEFPWAREGDTLDTALPFTVNTGSEASDTFVYASLQPVNITRPNTHRTFINFFIRFSS